MTNPNRTAVHACTLHAAPIRSCYVNCRCRCDGCRAANAAHQRRRYRTGIDRKGHPPKVDAGPVRRHVAMLAAGGMSYTAISRAAGLSHATVATLMRNLWPTVRQSTADKILAIPARTADTTGVVCETCDRPPMPGGARQCLPCFQKSATPRSAPSWDPRCGTYAGYARHSKRGERPCGACAEAKRTYLATRRGSA